MSSNLQHKLSHYEVPPPADTWENIAAALDQQDSTLSKKLYQYEVEPNVKVWDLISRKLDAGEETVPAVPFFKRYHRPLKYSGVAAAILLFGILSSLLLSKKTESEAVGQDAVYIKRATPAPPDDSAKNRNDVAVQQSAEPSRASEKIKTSRPAIRSGVFSFIDNRAEPENVAESTRPTDKYMLFIDGDGNAMRLSKKLFRAFACASYDYVCREHISALQAKVASSAVTTDFTGILDILKNLQENQ